MATEDDQFGVEISTELRLGLPGGGLEVDGGGKHRNMEVTVGGPPVCSYKTKRGIIEVYVKVSMDGAPFLRMIDVNGFKGYSDFIMALKNLFGLGNESDYEYIPIYKDKNGDWKPVGFVPWEIFTETCKRLRMKKRVFDGGLQIQNFMRKLKK